MIPRLLLAFSSLALGVGALIHASAFKKALTAIGGSNLPAFYAKSAKALWLADSATLFCVALAFAVIAARPSSASTPILLILALIPAATAALLFVFIGNFAAAHLLLIAALAAVAAAAGSCRP